MTSRKLAQYIVFSVCLLAYIIFHQNQKWSQETLHLIHLLIQVKLWPKNLLKLMKLIQYCLINNIHKQNGHFCNPLSWYCSHCISVYVSSYCKCIPTNILCIYCISIVLYRICLSIYLSIVQYVSLYICWSLFFNPFFNYH